MSTTLDQFALDSYSFYKLGGSHVVQQVLVFKISAGECA